MKILKIGMLLNLLLMTQPGMIAVSSSEHAKSKICEPDQSIANQRTKAISSQGKAILVKIMKDKISLSWPVEVCKCWISSLFGPRSTGFHNGLDLAALQGTPVYASAEGMVEVAQKSSDKSGYGNMILLSHEKLYFDDDSGSRMYYKTRYAHLHTLHVKEGDVVSKGQKIGTVGATGHVIVKHAKSDPSHLHFEVYRGKTRINPLIPLFASDRTWVMQNS